MNVKLLCRPRIAVMSISEALELHQREHGLSQRDMANALGVSSGTYNEILQGKRKFPYHAACRAYEMGISADVLLRFENIQPTRSALYTPAGERRPSPNTCEEEQK